MTTFWKKYDHTIESEVYKLWTDNNLFEPNNVHSLQKSSNISQEYIDIDGKYSIPLPPPNVTWSLHVWHALMMTIEDILTRYNRMCWRKTLWTPGTDHAGIATQAKVEWILQKKWINKNDLGRKKFLDEVWNFASSSRKEILSQLKKLWWSLDRSREQFSLSEKLSRAVRKSFSNSYKDWRIYRDTYITNRCSSCQTVISDIEVDMKSTQSKLYYVRYFLEWWNDSITVATVRPETIFADVAIAVNPNDSRYSKYIGKKVIKPMTTQLIPIIWDEAVDADFGTWALKITPAHDTTDYEIAKRHNLPTDILAIDKNWNFTDICNEELIWKSVAKHKENIVTTLYETDNIIKELDYENNVPHCERCGTMIEPMVSEQRFVNIKDVATKTSQAISNWELKIYPQRFESQLNSRLINMRPRCISRQLRRWHRIPIRYSEDWQAFSLNEDEIISKSNNQQFILSIIIFNLIADWRLENPFEIWDLVSLITNDSLVPQQGKIYQVYSQIYQEKFSNQENIINDIQHFENIIDNLTSQVDYETNIDKLIDIISQNIYIKQIKWSYYFDFEELTWAKWIKQDSDVLDTWFSSCLWPMTTLWRPESTQDMQTRYPQSTLTTWYEIIFTRVARMCIQWLINVWQLPFKEVFFNWIVRDEKGIKMSKSLWNVVDPNQVIADIWADALRLSVVMWITPWWDSNYSTTKTDYCSRFINKLRNASRFVYINEIEWKIDSISYEQIKSNISQNIDKINDFDKWILDKLNKITEQQHEYISKYQIWEYIQDLIQFVRHDFCDRYIEISKLEKSSYTSDILVYVLWSVYKLLHPYTPFVTEKLWKTTWFEWRLILQPITTNIPVKSIESNYTIMFIDIISQFRNLRAKNNIKNHDMVDVFVCCNSWFSNTIRKYDELLCKLIKINNIEIYNNSTDFDDTWYDSIYVFDNKIWIKLQEKEIDYSIKIKEIEKEIEIESKFLNEIETLLASPGFSIKAPENIIKTKQEKAEEIKNKIANLKFEINKLKVNKS